jgi:hypothetical protein
MNLGNYEQQCSHSNESVDTLTHRMKEALRS